MSRFVNRYRVAKITRLIDQQILLRVNQLATFVELQKSIDHRMVRGELREDDIKHIADKLAEMKRG